MNAENCRQFVVTCDQPWDPTEVKIAATKSKSRFGSTALNSLMMNISAIKMQRSNPALFTERCLTKISDTFDDRAFKERIIANVNVVSANHHESNAETPKEGDPPRRILSINSETRHTTITVEEVCKKFRCGIKTAKKTLQKTTQRDIRRSLNLLHRRYHTYHLDLHRNRLDVSFSSDTLFAKVKSFQGNSCAQLYTTGKYTKLYPMPDKTAVSIGETILDVFNNVGIPNEMITDLGSEIVGRPTPFCKEVIKRGAPLKNAKKGRHGQNTCTESEINQLKKRWKDLMIRKKVPARLWDYALVWISEILSHTARGKDGTPGIEQITGQTADLISTIWYGITRTRRRT
jgi:hypothetical protein